MRRCDEPGWVRIGSMDAIGRRSLWMRMNYVGEGRKSVLATVELCSGREGDDLYCQINAGDPNMKSVLAVLVKQYGVVTTELEREEARKEAE